MTPLPRRGRRTTAALALLTATLVPGLAQLPALAADTPAPSPDGRAEVSPLGTIADPVAGLDDLDVRGALAPSAAQRAAVGDLGAVTLRWNDSGTPASILPADGVLARAEGTPVQAARTWIADHATLLGLTPQALGDLELVSNQHFADSPARAVLFRQTFGGLPAARGGLVTVGVARGEIAYVSSSLSKATGTPVAPALSPLQGWLAAAAGVGREVEDSVVGDIVSKVTGGWTRLAVPGFAQQQQVRLRALPMPGGSVRPVFEANVLDTEGGSAFGYTSLVDAVTGETLVRQNQVENSMYSNVFQGTFSGTECGPEHEFELTDDATQSITAVGLALPVDDLVVKFFDPDGELLYTGDLLTSPEVATYASDDLPAGVYSAQVCPFDDASVVVGQYALLLTTSDTGTPDPGGLTPDPRWRYFTANPSMSSTTSDAVPDNSVIGCWVAGDGCTTPTGPFRNVAAPGPWDTLVTGGLPTMTTIGNNANTHEAWLNPLAPGGLVQAPVSPTRDYTTEFTDAWNNSQCDPAQLVPGGNDIDVSVGNLFVAHNRMHDYSYYLGFTEANYNLQLDNLGRGGVGGDQEIGNSQAGAITGGQPLLLGRDNANQIALQDGIPGITNQYLFQPIAGSFYAPCTDGGLDMGIVGHEYTHAISNRMIGGPDEGITSEQGGAMGESWSDLVAGEYMFSHGYRNGGNPWAIGVYATGNKQVAIRDYAINKNPLNYSDYGFDTTGAEVHADGEIWNGTQWSVRQAMVRKYDERFPYDNAKLQLRCAQATPTQSPLPASECPGNRRWVQLLFDSFLLQQGATSMLDARDAMLAADRMRFGGRDLKVMWKAFAHRGMGKGASTPDADSEDVTASFASPKHRNATVTLRSKGGTGRLYVGRYEARATPVLDTKKQTEGIGAVGRFAPGTYQLLYVSSKHGFTRFTVTLKPGQKKTILMRPEVNLASKEAGGKVIGATAGSLNPAFLIDGTERTNWGGVTEANVDESMPSVAVDLAGGTHVVRRVAVSAMLNPAPASSDPIPLAVDEDPDSGSRFTALRSFALEACVEACASEEAVWKRFFTSGGNAFPGVQPRPVAPNLTLRGFRVPATKAAAVRLVTLENQCTGYAGYAGEQDADPLNATDCATGSDRGTIVHAAELQVFAR